MNKKAIAGILARLDDPDQIETLLELIANKAEEPPAATKPKQRRKSSAPRARQSWPTSEDKQLLALADWDWTYEDIAARLGRSKKAVKMRLYRLRKGENA